jgi:hypothetical protein
MLLYKGRPRWLESVAAISSVQRSEKSLFSLEYWDGFVSEGSRDTLFCDAFRRHPTLLNGCIPGNITQLIYSILEQIDLQNQKLESEVGVDYHRLRSYGLASEIPANPEDPYSFQHKGFAYSMLGARVVEWLMWAWENDDGNCFDDWASRPQLEHAWSSLQLRAGTESAGSQCSVLARIENSELHTSIDTWLGAVTSNSLIDPYETKVIDGREADLAAAVISRLKSRGENVLKVGHWLRVYKNILELAKFIVVASKVMLLFSQLHLV